MKILYYSPHPDLVLNAQSGYGTHMREMIKAFSVSGFEVTPLIMGGIDVIERTPSAHSGKSSLKNRVKSIVPRILWESIKDANLLKIDQQYASILEKKILEIKPDLIYERAAYMQLSGVHAAKKYRIPHILEMNSPYIVERKVRHETGSLMTFKARSIEKEQLLLSDVPAVVSPALKEYFVDEHNIDSSKIICTHNAIDPVAVVSDEKRVREIRAQYHLDGRQVIGFVGSINTYQRVDLLIEAAGTLAKRYADLCFLIVGDSPSVNDLKAQCERLGITENVIFTGNVPHKDVFNFVEAMDITVLPDNLWYGSPTKIFEYGAMGKPVVAPDNLTMQDIILDGKEGLLVKPEGRCIAEAISFLLDNPGKSMEMGLAFQRKVYDRFTWSRNVESVIEALPLDSKQHFMLGKE